MGQDWILDVLADLRTFALSNGMTALAEQLDDARMIAQVEIAGAVEGGRLEQAGTNIAPGAHPGGVGTSGRA